MRLHALVESVAAATAAVDAGATVVQVRLKSASTADRAALGRSVRHLPAMLVINDDVEAALACAADGVHLGQDDPGATYAVNRGLRLGVSVSTVEEAIAAVGIGASYLGAGPVWATPSKVDAVAPIGLDGLRVICGSVSIAVVAIGGIDASNAASCIDCGAAGVAVVRAAGDPQLREVVDAALRELSVS